MKVIEPGRKQTGYSVEAKCSGNGNGGGGCGAKLLVEQPDMRYYEGTDYPIYRSSAVTFRCCSCGVLTDLDRKDWPPSASSLPAYSNAWAQGHEGANDAR